ncbi:MAG: T9SS type A sorting domain-containing protein [Bacteroidota bacterium]
MKLTSTFALLFSVTFLCAQQTITSEEDGLATNPLIWDCSCIPSPDDEIIIEHDVTMNSNWVANNGGSITVTDQGTLIQDNQNRTILFDGSAAFYNYGNTALTNLAFSGGAEGHNHASLSLDTALWVGPGSIFMNHGLTENVDSTYIQGMFMNEGTYSYGDFLNEGNLSNTGYIEVDSMYNNQGTINSSAGNIKAMDFASNGTVNITGSSYMLITNDFFNGGTLNLEAGRDIHVGSDFLNASEGDTAVVLNDGLIEIGNDFSNVDTLRGSGLFCIAQNSSNSGDVLETLDICDNTGTSIFDFNSGNVAATVTNCNAGCNVGINEEQESEIAIYPNPVSTVLNIDGIDEGLVTITDVMGQTVYSSRIKNQINVNDFRTGIYFITVENDGQQSMLKFIKR